MRRVRTGGGEGKLMLPSEKRRKMALAVAGKAVARLP